MILPKASRQGHSPPFISVKRRDSGQGKGSWWLANQSLYYLLILSSSCASPAKFYPSLKSASLLRCLLRSALLDSSPSTTYSFCFKRPFFSIDLFVHPAMVSHRNLIFIRLFAKVMPSRELITLPKKLPFHASPSCCLLPDR